MNSGADSVKISWCGDKSWQAR